MSFEDAKHEVEEDVKRSLVNAYFRKLEATFELEIYKDRIPEFE